MSIEFSTRGVEFADVFGGRLAKHGIEGEQSHEKYGWLGDKRSHVFVNDEGDRIFCVASGMNDPT
jgi:hypothetical protein